MFALPSAFLLVLFDRLLFVYYESSCRSNRQHLCNKLRDILLCKSDISCRKRKSLFFSLLLTHHYYPNMASFNFEQTGLNKAKRARTMYNCDECQEELDGYRAKLNHDRYHHGMNATDSDDNKVLSNEEASNKENGRQCSTYVVLCFQTN